LSAIAANAAVYGPESGYNIPNQPVSEDNFNFKAGTNGFQRRAAMRQTMLIYTLGGLIFLLLLAIVAGCSETTSTPQTPRLPPEPGRHITIFVTGDVMTGRGIDQALPHPGNPLIHESYMKSAAGYVQLAEQAHGLFKTPLSYDHIWGDALVELELAQPDVRIVNLETSITTSDDAWPDKAIHYRMNPANIPVLTVANVDACSLANNHVLDWGPAGLTQTLQTLAATNIKYAGGGQNLAEAAAPALLEVSGKGRVVLFSYGLPSSGIPVGWAATRDRAGINLLPDLSGDNVAHIKKAVAAVEQSNDIIVASIHWGSNWGYDISVRQAEFAHDLIEQAGIDLVHGHSSHHVRGIEVYRGKLIIYGAGDFINDYEGIRGYEQFRDDLALMYFASLDPATGQLVSLTMIPMQIKNFGLNRTSRADALWLQAVLNREGARFGTRVELGQDNRLTLRWR
jgi:poly-gamma-glutamate synthesis protein (capsule biosynthesis protein)